MVFQRGDCPHPLRAVHHARAWAWLSVVFARHGGGQNLHRHVAQSQAHAPRTASRTSAAWPAAFTLRQIWEMRP